MSPALGAPNSRDFSHFHLLHHQVYSYKFERRMEFINLMGAKGRNWLDATQESKTTL
jgi:hypothetical protein